MATLIATISHQPTLLGWAAQSLGNEGPWCWGLDAIAMGVVDRETGEIRAVVVLNAFFDDSCYAHIVSDGGRAWASEAILRRIFTFIFGSGRASRAIAVIPHTNIATITMMVKLGFTIEGRVRSTMDGKKANVVATMFRDECRWLGLPKPDGDTSNGQE